MSIKKVLDVAAAEKTWLQRSAEESLVPNLFMVELRGAPKTLTWPPICANCGWCPGADPRPEGVLPIRAVGQGI
jgi:hypothetical protein